MAYIIKYFKPATETEELLKTQCYIQNVNDEYVLLINGVQTTYIPNVWSALLCEEFNTDPSQFIRDKWVNLSFLHSKQRSFNHEANKLKKCLSLEQQFIIDSVYAKSPKSGSSFIAAKIDSDMINYSMLGDNFLFIYNEKTKSLLAYCSMVDKKGQLDLSQPCHCIYNDLTLLGTPINGQKSLKDSICFILSRDLASWFVESCKGNLLQTIDALLNIKSDEDYDKFLQKVESQQKYKHNPFDKSTSCCMIIQKDKSDTLPYSLDQILTWYKKHIVTCSIAIAVLIAFLFFIFGTKEKEQEKTKEGTPTKVEMESPDKVGTPKQ